MTMKSSQQKLLTKKCLLSLYENDSLEETDHQYTILRVETNDEEIITTEASDEGMPPLPPLETH